LVGLAVALGAGVKAGFFTGLGVMMAVLFESHCGRQTGVSPGRRGENGRLRPLTRRLVCPEVTTN